MFEFWPYTNFHTLNLDWIIKEVKENNRKVEEFSEQLEAMGVSIQQMQEYIDNIDAEIQAKVDTEVPAAIQEAIATGGFNQVVSEAHRPRLVIIGDSYSQGWTPDGRFTSWSQLVKTQMNLSDANCIIEDQGGAGFGNTVTDGRRYVPALVQAAYERATNPETFTDIIIGLGYNDYLYAADTTPIDDGITNTLAACRTYFPFAKIHLFGVGFTTNTANAIKLNTVYDVYSRNYRDYSFNNISESLNHVSFFSSDGIHPVQAGHNRLARNVIRCLYGGNPDYYFTLLSATSTTFELLMGNPGQTDSMGLAIAYANGKLYLTTQGQFKFITIGNSGSFTMSGNNVYKLAKLVSMGEYTGYFYPNQYIAFPAKMYAKENGSNTYTTHDITLTIGTDSTGTDVFLYITVLGASGGSFISATNVTGFGFQGVCAEIPFIANCG